MRCEGMTLAKMPLFVWVMLVDAWMILLALPPLSAAQIMLLADRYLGATFFNTQAGGSAVLWQHFFWIFGHPGSLHPDLPGFRVRFPKSFRSFRESRFSGEPAMVGAIVAIGFISMGVWAHHMFTVGMTSMSNIFFATPPW